MGRSASGRGGRTVVGEIQSPLFEQTVRNVGGVVVGAIVAGELNRFPQLEAIDVFTRCLRFSPIEDRTDPIGKFRQEFALKAVFSVTLGFDDRIVGVQQLLEVMPNAIGRDNPKD